MLQILFQAAAYSVTAHRLISTFPTHQRGPFAHTLRRRETVSSVLPDEVLNQPAAHLHAHIQKLSPANMDYHQ